MAQRWICSVCGYTWKGPVPPQNCPSCGSPFTAFERRERDPMARFRHIEIAQERPAGFRYVIVGNSAAGRSAARAINALDDDGSVTVMAEEPERLYARPMLPDYIGGRDRDLIFGVAEAFPTQRLEIVTDRAVSVDPAGKTVTCASGREVPWDALLLATGSTPRQIPWPGSDAQGIHYFRFLSDAEAISAAVESAEHAVVVGGGLLGLEFVRAFHMRGLPTTILIRGAAVGEPALDEEGGEIIRHALDGWGVEVALEEEVESFIAEGGRAARVKTTKGRTIRCGAVGVAVGALPRIELAQDAGLEVDRGIVVDERMRSSNPEIYAAGDVAQAYDIVRGQRSVNTSWRNSQQQGEAAGICMAGGAPAFAGALAANYQLAGGIPFCAIGIANPAEEGYQTEVTIDADAGNYRKLVMRDGKLVGATLVGDLSEAPDIEDQIREAFGPADEGGQARASKPTPAAKPVPKPQATPEEEMTRMHKMTEQNLKDAFAGESQAHMKYLNFAKKADEEGKSNVARLFRATSFAEQAHASHHLDVLGGIGSTAENLAEGAGGEDFEVEEMYPAYKAVADLQDEDEAFEAFDYAMRAEMQHSDLYHRAQQAVDAGGDANFDAIMVCPFCGHTIEGEAPDKCPVCNTPGKEFVKF